MRGGGGGAAHRAHGSGCCVEKHAGFVDWGGVRRGVVCWREGKEGKEGLQWQEEDATSPESMTTSATTKLAKSALPVQLARTREAPERNDA